MPSGPTVLFKGPIRGGKKPCSGGSSRLVDPHTNVGSLALAMMGAQSVRTCERVSSSPSSVPATGSRPIPGPQIPEQKCSLYMDIPRQQQPTYSKSLQKTLATSTLA